MTTEREVPDAHDDLFDGFVERDIVTDLLDQVVDGVEARFVTQPRDEAEPQPQRRIRRIS